MNERKQCDNPKDPIINSQFNKNYFIREDLRNDIYELEASDTFTISTSDIPVVCFIIDVSLEANRLFVLGSVLNSIREVFKNGNFNKRAKAAFFFFNESIFVLNTNHTFSVINVDVPLILSEKILFSMDSEDEFCIQNLKYDLVEKYFADKKSDKSNYLLAVKVAIQAFRSASLLNFISTVPNYSESKINLSSSIICKNSQYKTVSESLVNKNISANLFIMARTSVEFSTLKVLSQFTGGQVFHYANYDGNDEVSTTKFYTDLQDYFSRDIGYNAICRIRANEGVVLKSAYGNFFQKGPDLLAYANFNPAHSLNFTIQLYDTIKTALYLQIAMIRATKTGIKLIRIMNICIPIHPGSFYDFCDSYSIAHALSLEAFYYESKAKTAGNKFLKDKIETIWSEIKPQCGRIPESLQNLPILISSMMKGIALRPDIHTPVDFRGYYMYLMANSASKIIDLIMYPLLVNILEENVVPKQLSVSSIDNSSIYILDAGVNIFFFIGKNCNPEIVASLFQDVKSGPFVFSLTSSDFSKYVSDLLVFLLGSRTITPRYILVNGNETSVYYDIFFSYMYDDRMHDLPSSLDFFNRLESK